MLDYTEKELRKYFTEYFEQFAEILNIKIDELYDKFKFMYNGFRFCDEEERLYNPYLVGKALDYQKMDNYWFESGTPTFLVDLIKEGDFDITKIQNIEVDRSKLKAYDITKLKLIPMLFQTGYLTIKDIEDGIIYKLGYPNHEVESGLSQNLLESITEEKVETPIIHRGLLTIDKAEANKVILKIPNYAARVLYWEYMNKIYDVESISNSFEVTKAMKKMRLKGDIDDIFDIYNRFRNSLSNRDLRWYNETTSKVIFAMLAQIDGVYLIETEREATGGYADIYLRENVKYREAIKYNYLMEFKHIKSSQLKGDLLKDSQEEILEKNKDMISERKKDARKQLEQYVKERNIFKSTDKEIRMLIIITLGKKYLEYWPTERGFDRHFGLIGGAANYFDIRKTKAEGVTREMALDGKPWTRPGDNFYMTDAITDYALNFLDEDAGGEEPFFLYLAYTAPHWPLHALPEDIEKYKGKYLKGWDKLRKDRYNNLIKLGIIDEDWSMSPRDEEIIPWEEVENKEELDLKMAIYAAQIDRMDQGIGRVIEKIEEMEKKENTVVMFLSDNGGCHEGGPFGFDRRENGLPPGGVDSYMSYGRAWANLSNTPFRMFKHWVHEGGISTPFIINWPQEIKESKITDSLAHITDITATCIDIAGVEYPEEYRGNEITPLEGESFKSIISGEDRERENPIFWEHEGNRAQFKL